MGKRKAKDISESAPKRRSPRFTNKHEATAVNAIKPNILPSTGSKSASELKASPEVQGLTESKINASPASEPTALPEIPTSTEAKIDTSPIISEPTAPPEIPTSTEAKIDTSPAAEPTASPAVQTSTEAKQPDVPLDKHGLPKLPDERHYRKPIVWTRPKSLSHKGEWHEGYDDMGKKLFQNFKMSVSGWISQHCYTEAELRKRLSAGDLQIILDSLGDFCLYKDWKSIRANLDKTGHQNFWFLLPSTVLLKHLFEEVIANPFVYIEGSQEDTSSQSSMVPPVLGKELCKLWKRLAKVDPVRASEWRRTTTQLLNQVHPEKTKDWRVAYQTGEVQESLAHRLATGMLTECKALQVVLKEMTDSDDDDDGPAERYEGLVDIYRSAIDMSIYLGTVEPDFEFALDVRQCGPYLHRKNRVRKRGCSDEIRPDEWPIPVLLNFPLVSSCRMATPHLIDHSQWLREEFRNWDENKEDLQERMDKEIPEVEEGDTVLLPAVYFVEAVYSKDGPRACLCGGRFVCRDGCGGETVGDDGDDDDEEEEDDGSDTTEVDG
ncbi:hypothetical protein ASPBRDRAFT_66928 [Aspergillus brasiliensis CBS 101740]|uniref:Uncharacterized protein n=1 Tax=Aspergillus brasiliensis (strain CBS 101740 / IMI 381727 / IBT 21946) TaxID=767769 RepID=A0A1L9UE03_ASPBC|nr:hypothetical protein ASPBRDRAFT_66928 [Aspergillus brasiliensis CBS 101740]